MPRGSIPGERRGGRQKGVPNKRTAAKAVFLVSPGVSPLDIILGAARAAWAAAHDSDGRIDVKKAQIAADIAKDAAPYLHSRLMPASQPGGDDDMAKARRIKAALAEIEGVTDGAAPA